ncbi:hypothetical protein AAFF_G00146350 [Aldrovandia affinis]|uniref:Uncharacterized protein n=1 Tax=Aldrovandia affinis TaxID=143900 RepID=A0AAD7RPV0_9TELE|nr:hypothetical protein AAFF_G00146350 [Aldrovandia affinis]
MASLSRDAGEGTERDCARERGPGGRSRGTRNARAIGGGSPGRSGVPVEVLTSPVPEGRREGWTPNFQQLPEASWSSWPPIGAKTINYSSTDVQDLGRPPQTVIAVHAAAVLTLSTWAVRSRKPRRAPWAFGPEGRRAARPHARQHEPQRQGTG